MTTDRVLCSLHWLPVKFRIDSKILSITFKAIYGHAPGYLIDLIVIKERPRYNLRSASSASPNSWNNLRLHIRLYTVCRLLVAFCMRVVI